MKSVNSRFREDLETEWLWRQDELRLLQNQAAKLRQSKEVFLRSIVVMLYAHFEGFVRFAFQAYIIEINNADLRCEEVVPAIVAATLHDALKELRNPTKKCRLFKSSLPLDEKLHLFSREQDFIEALDGLSGTKVKVPDKFVDTESNLKPSVLRKLLFQVGLQYDLLSTIESSLDKLLQYRNSIAHGTMKQGVDWKTYLGLRDTCFSAVSTVMRELTDAVNNSKYKRAC